MSSWTPAPCGVALRRDVNRAFPSRDKRSDGVIGDASHAARPSDHNPDRTWAKNNYVRAVDIDITPDGNPNLDLRTLLIRAAVKDKRTYYVISNGVIYSRTRAFRARKYNGSNPHNGHVHISFRGGVGDRSISVKLATQLNNDTSVWDITSLPPTPVGVPPEKKVSPTLRDNIVREPQLIAILNTWNLTPYRRQVFTEELDTVYDVIYHRQFGKSHWDNLAEELDAKVRFYLNKKMPESAAGWAAVKKRFDHLRRQHPRKV